MMKRLRIPAITVALLLGAASVFALPAQRSTAKKPVAKADPNAVVFFRCVDAHGMVSLQNDRPCAKGQTQSRVVVQKPAPANLPAASPATPMLPAATVAPVATPVVAPAAAPVIDAPPAQLPPPPLYRCYTMQQKSYLSDNGAPKSRCVPLSASNADPNDPNAPKVCDMQQDTCERIPDQDACAAWAQYDREARALVEMGHPDYINEATALAGRTAKVMTQTTCAK